MVAGKFSSGRRLLLKGMLGVATVALLPAAIARSQGTGLSGVIPATAERIPAIGMGTWITFNTPPLTDARRRRVEVLRTFFESGGTLVDSSPMYGLAEATLGYCLEELEELEEARRLFAATKVWTPTRLAGVAQMKASMSLWGLDRIELMQVHNMVDWETHLRTLLEMKEAGTIRYIGITTSHGRRHREMLKVIETRPEFDFVQFTYNVADREAEKTLLPAAAHHGKAVIINRPFKRGALFDRVDGKPLPDWAGEFGCQNWAQFFLKFVISHPAVTCAIPATSRVNHMLENMGALEGELPDGSTRQRMQEYFVDI